MCPGCWQIFWTASITAPTWGEGVPDMGMFFADDRYDESRRMEGFGRYKQLLSFYAGRWVKVNLLTVLGALPLALGIAFAILTSSILVLIPAGLVGGAGVRAFPSRSL